jgi:3-deoxy-D-manno-octulosonic-acid transferase
VSFWPALIAETHKRGMPMMIVNARMSKTSHDRWRFLPGMARSLLGRFDRGAGARRHHGDVPSPSGHDRHAHGGDRHAQGRRCRAALRRGRTSRDDRASGRAPVWLAASTHEGEERIVLDAHNLALKVNPRLLLILAPRHPNRGDEIAQMLQSDRWRFNRRTAGEMPDAEANVYLADTMGELGLWYRVAPTSLVGGSLQPIGGHNPFEPAALGSAILHGPFVTNFVDIYQRLTEAGAARLVTGPDTLAEAVHELMNPDKAASMAHAAWEVVSQGAEVTDRALDAIFDRLDAGQAARGA